MAQSGIGLILRVIAASFGAALVMTAWSEFVFFNEDPSTALIRALDQGLWEAMLYAGELGLFYMLPATLLVGLTSLFGSLGMARVMLIGALTGFSIEGALVPAVYEAVPLSFLWTSVAWHGPITVALGVFLIPRFMATLPVFGWAAVVLTIGAFWALWTPWPWQSENFDPVSASVFGGFAIATTFIMGVGYLLLRAAGWPEMILPGWAAGALLVPSIFFFAVNGLHFPVAALALGVICLALGAALRRIGQGAEPGYTFGWTGFSMLGLLPVAAFIVYEGVLATGPLMNPEDQVLLVLFFGLIIWGGAVVRGLRRSRVS